MNLELYEEDLLKELRDCPTSSIGFDHLTTKAQEAVSVVGKATFYRNKGTVQENCNVVYPHKN
jgi:hypothetical protein